jgi:hypothetical protein
MMRNMTPKEVNQNLNALIESFKNKSLAYYLHFESSERKLDQEIKNKIKEKYGLEKFMPAMGWTETFGDIADSDILDEQIQKYLNTLNYDQENFVLPKDRIKNMLWNNARSEGKKILAEVGS